MAIPGQDGSGLPEPPIAAVVAGMQERLGRLPARLSHERVFLSTYQRTTAAVGEAVDGARFEDPGWVERWDVAFADLYLSALDTELAGGHVPRPWRLAFAASPDLPPLRHVLLGINAHVNYDLPQALLAVISDDDFADPLLMDRRRRDHERIDNVLASRVAAEDDELTATGGATILDRLLAPLNRLGSKRFLREARQKVWHNTIELQQARVKGPEQYAVRLAELELLSAAKIADLLRPGQVLLRLAVSGFGVSLPPPETAEPESDEELGSDEELAEVVRRELQLLEPVCRARPAAVLALLHPDFLEFGASGRRWDAASTAELLAQEDSTAASRVSDLVPVRLADDVVLLTYTAARPDDVSLRSSVWLRHPEKGWVLRFHQGTTAGSPSA